MKRWVVAGPLAGVIVAVVGVPSLASVISSHDSGAGRTMDASTGHDRRPGPPPWAHGHSKPGKTSGPQWKKLTPEKHAIMMDKLARQHADGMKGWATCVAARRDDCVRPLPPGLAKKH